MADDAEIVKEWIDKSTEAAVGGIRVAAAQIPTGEAGECDYCGEYFIRIVRGACGRCRDKRGLGW